MPQPADVDRAAQELIGLFRQAQADIETQLQAIVDTPTAGRRRARLRELDRSIGATLDGLEADTRTWLGARFPDTYGLGAQDAAAQLGERFEWTQPHLSALQTLVDATYADVLAATTYVRGEAKAFLRAEARKQVALSLTEGRTSTQAARVFANAAGEVVDMLGGNVGMIRYADGSYHRLADYADMLLRTKVAEAHNAGTLNTLTQHGVTFVEVLDGADCGWTHHNSGDKANGTVRPIEEAYQQPLSHPRCRRSFAARPEIRQAAVAKNAQSIRSEASMADQAQAERERADVFARRRASRTERQPRQRRQRRNATR